MGTIRALCVCEGRACSAGAGEVCKWPGEPRVCTRGAGVRGTMRYAVHGVAEPGKGPRRALCRACVCKRGAGVRSARVCRRAGSLEPGGPRRWEGALRASARRARTHPGSAEGPPLPLRLRLGLRLGLPGSRPASRSAHEPAPSPAVAGGATPAVCPRARLGGARRGPGARPGRGGSRELRRSPGTLPGARRALPHARPPAPSLK